MITSVNSGIRRPEAHIQASTTGNADLGSPVSVTLGGSVGHSRVLLSFCELQKFVCVCVCVCVCLTLCVCFSWFFLMLAVDFL